MQFNINSLLKPKEVETTKNSFQDWLNIKEITSNRITLNSGKKICIIKVEPVNFRLKSSLEQQSILNQYKNFLKNINSKIQIVISSKKTDISIHMDKIIKVSKENPDLSEIIQDYICLVNQTIREKGSVTKEFFIVIEENNNIENDIIKILEYLNSCGNEASVCEKELIIKLISNFTNNRIINLS